MRSRGALLAAMALAACRHLPPDRAARDAAPPPAPSRTPEAEEIRGAWFAPVVRGVLGELGHAAVYVFGPDGRYTGALVGPAECVSVAGTYAYREGRLVLDDGALEFEASLKDGRLELLSPATYLELVPLPPEGFATSGAPRTVGPEPSPWNSSPVPPAPPRG